jgi:peptidoglycan/xylan/chitin deacetylase (PgdA/CDA1 family)
VTRRIACWTLDLEPDFLSDNTHEVFWDDERFGRFEAFMLQNHLPLTVFVVARMLEEGLPVKTRFERIATEFELHSYSHDLSSPDSLHEITKGKRIYTLHFGQPPRGYRAPTGAISHDGLQILHREGFHYDASVFPAWRPELGYNFRRLPNEPFCFEEFPGLIELPFATVPKIRAVLSLSYLKLLGLQFYKAAFRVLGLPQVIVFDSHLYDYFPTTTVNSLPRTDWRRLALTRNQANTMNLVQQLFDYLADNGYTFATMGELHARVSQSTDALPRCSALALQ